MSLKSLFIATGSLAAIVVAAAPANAVVTTFATFTALSQYNVDFVGSGANATYFTISANNGLTPGPVHVAFNFINEPAVLVNAVTGVDALFTLNAAVANSPALVTRKTVEQDDITGSFSFRSTSAIKVGGRTFAAGSNLLSATFVDGVILGNKSSTNSAFTADNNLNTAPDDSLVYTSDFVSFVPTADLGAALSSTSGVPGLVALANDTLSTFRANATGSFSADPAPTVNTVPEPSSWALMLVGFGLAGISIRSRVRGRAAAV